VAGVFVVIGVALIGVVIEIILIGVVVRIVLVGVIVELLLSVIVRIHGATFLRELSFSHRTPTLVEKFFPHHEPAVRFVIPLRKRNGLALNASGRRE
jgi:hypothetical protein